MHPAAQGDRLVHQGLVELAAIMAAHVVSCSIA
jgi:hypothetical protein